MRVNINLASRPYQDVRQFLLRWGALLALLAVFSGGLLYYAFHSWRQSRDVNASIASLRAEITQLDRERQKGIDLLNRPENRDVTTQSRFLNQVIARKAFSWTHVFEDLERMMPPRLHVVSIQPELDKSNQLQLKLMVAGDSRERAVELIRRLEDSPTFRHAQLHAETATTPGAGNATDTIRFEITSQYLPSRSAAVPAKESKAEGTAKVPKSERPAKETAPPDRKQPARSRLKELKG